MQMKPILGRDTRSLQEAAQILTKRQKKSTYTYTRFLLV